MSKHTPYPVGTLYSNSLYYDVALNEFAHGFQVFEQRGPDGTPTGRRSILDNNGVLRSTDIAGKLRAEAVRDSAPELLAALKDILRIARAASIGVSGHSQRFQCAEAAIAKAEGN
jgi:hypothetical protein